MIKKIELYADDFKLYKGTENVQNCIKIQGNLELISEWCITNLY